MAGAIFLSMARGIFEMSVNTLVGILVMLIVLGLLLGAVLLGYDAFGGGQNALAFAAPAVVAWLKVSTKLS